jgi:hypothetical protein
MAQKEKVPVKYYELVDKKNSGFIMNGTEGTPYQQELMGPSIQWISSTGRTCEIDEKGIKHYIDIRYISGCDSIYPEKQKERGFSPNRFEDKIPFENNFTTVVREGNGIAQYDYLEKAFWNQDNPDRPATATPRYREVKLDKKAEVLLDEDEMQTHAKMLIYELRQTTGDKKVPFKYNTDRINSICRLVNVWDETPERQLMLLLSKAMQNPKEFLEVVTRSEQTLITEVSHAIELKVIRFDGNTVQSVDENKIYVSLGNEKIKEKDKIEKFASWLATYEGTNSLTELRAKVELAKEKLFQN